MKKKVNKVKKSSSHELGLINPNAAGIDVGSRSLFVAVPMDRDEKCVREFPTFTPDLKQLLAWLKKCKITSVVMESTGVFWIPIYELLEAAGFEVLLANARHVKTVPGRKSDVMDCQWLQKLHAFGLLNGSFRPSEEICVLRGFMRQRDMLIKNAATHIQHMQKALMQMNIQLHNVLSDITGETGMVIIRAIVMGERDPAVLARHRDKGCKNSLETIQKSLEGNYRKEHVFALTQALQLYDFYHEKILECDQEIKKILEKYEPKSFAPEEVNKRKGRTKRRPKNGLHFDVRGLLIEMTGVDLTHIDGLNSHTALRLLSEVGLDMSRWKTAKHFGSWLCLSPGSKISGGKRLSSRTVASANRAAEIFRLAAYGLSRSHSALGAFFRRKKAQLGAPKAITATAYKIARMFYMVLKHGKNYEDPGERYYEEKYQEQIIKSLTRKAEKLGMALIKKEALSC